MNTKDFIGPCCSCGQCVQAGVTTKETRRDPRSGAWLHGYQLKSWYEARDKFLALSGQIGAKEMP